MKLINFSKRFFKPNWLFAIALTGMSFIALKASAGSVIESVTVSHGELSQIDWWNYSVEVPKSIEKITLTVHLDQWTWDNLEYWYGNHSLSFRLNEEKTLPPGEYALNLELTLQPGENGFICEFIVKDEKGNEDVWETLTITVIRGISFDVIALKGGAVVFQSAVSAIDNIIFYDPAGSETPASTETLLIHKVGDTAYNELLLDDIQTLSLSGWDLSVEKQHAVSIQYDLDEIEKLTFGGTFSGIRYPSQDKLNVVAYFTREGNLVVENSASIQSLTLFGIDGKIISTRNVPSGIYLVRVETSQGVVVKKVIKQ